LLGCVAQFIGPVEHAESAGDLAGPNARHRSQRETKEIS
jgi:hypothetical protein